MRAAVVTPTEWDLGFSFESEPSLKKYIVYLAADAVPKSFSINDAFTKVQVTHAICTNVATDAVFELCTNNKPDGPSPL